MSGHVGPGMLILNDSAFVLAPFYIFESILYALSALVN